LTLPLLLFALFTLAVLIQLVFILVIFSRTAAYRPAITDTPDGFSAGVSVVVCAWNEVENLQQLLPLLLEQRYPDFEVIVVDDRSDDGTFELLRQESERHPNLRRLHIEQTPKHITAKKYALTLGIRAAQKAVVLLTDADCRPSSPDWITAMTRCLSPGKDIVLGYSPYKRQPGLLNAFIRFETFFTALQYCSLALAGVPYMGVGRNLLYRRSLFLENQGFSGHHHVVGGDDDLFVGRVATATNTAVCLDPAAFVWSRPKTSWQNWYWQKRRHLSVGKLYQPRFRVLLGVLSLSQVFTYLLFTGLVGAFALLQDWLWLGITLGLFGLRLVAQWVVYAAANRRLGNITSAWTVPFYDALLTGYFVLMGSVTVLSRKKVKWK
jgi:glycosyltransferase involved in cell wall biosynthesis